MEQYRLFDDFSDKVKRAIQLFQMFEDAAVRYHEDGYYLAFSGGKDSVVLYVLAKMAHVKFQAHYHLTTVDPPELVRFIREAFPDVKVEYPELTMWDLIVKKQMPPLRTARYCCEVLKEGGGEGAFTVTGVRWEESRKLESGAFSMPFPVYDTHFLNFIDDVSNSDLMDVSYGDTLEEYGLGMNNELTKKIDTADLRLAKAILTCYVRQERFCDGLWGRAIKEGTFLALLKRIDTLLTL